MGPPSGQIHTAKLGIQVGHNQESVEINHNDYKKVSDYTPHIREVYYDTTDMRITIADLVIIHTLNRLGPMFENYLSIIAADVRDKAVLPSFRNSLRISRMRRSE